MNDLTTPLTAPSGTAAQAFDAAPDSPAEVMMDPAAMTVAVFSAPDQPTAEVVRGALIGEGVPAVIGEQVADALAGQLSLAEGYYAEVRVPAEYEKAARQIIAAFESGQTGVSDEEFAAQAEAASDPGV